MKKIHGKGRIILYAMSGMGINILNIMVGSYLCSALLVGGFGESVIPYQTYAQRDLIIPAVWSMFALVSKIIDGIIDIPLASFADRMRTRWGRRRPVILGGMVLTVICYLLFRVIPNPNGASLLNTVYYGGILCLYYCFYTLTMVTYYATYTEVFETTAERNLVSNAKSVFDIFYFLIGYVFVRMMLTSINIRIVAMMVLPLSLTMLIPLFMLKETGNEETQSYETVRLIPALKLTAKNKHFMTWMVVYCFITFGVQLVLSGINEYFSFVKMNMILVMTSAFAPVPFTLILYNKITKKHGFGVAFRCVLLIYALGMTAMGLTGIFAPESKRTLFSIISGVCSSFSIGALFSVAYSIPSQLAADEEKKTGISNSAMYFAVQGLFAGVATGIGSGVVLTALKGSENNPTDAIKYMTLISAAGCLVAFFTSWILPKSLMMMGKETD